MLQVPAGELVFAPSWYSFCSHVRTQNEPIFINRITKQHRPEHSSKPRNCIMSRRIFRSAKYLISSKQVNFELFEECLGENSTVCDEFLARR